LGSSGYRGNATGKGMELLTVPFAAPSTAKRAS
jgi:hypothetical protein